MLYECFELNDIYDAEGQLGALTGLLEMAFQEYQHKVTVKELAPKTKDEKQLLVLEKMKDLTVSEMMTYMNALKNAIETHRFLKTKEWTFKDLEIKLLD